LISYYASPNPISLKAVLSPHGVILLPGIYLAEVQFLSRYAAGRGGRVVHQGPFRGAGAIERGVSALVTQSPQETGGRRAIASERKAQLISIRKKCQPGRQVVTHISDASIRVESAMGDMLLMLKRRRSMLPKVNNRFFAQCNREKENFLRGRN